MISTTPPATPCDRVMPGIGTICGAPAVVRIVGLDDNRAHMYDRCSRHRGEAIRYITRQPGGRVVKETNA